MTFDLIKMISTFADMETLENNIPQEQTTETKPRNPNWGGRREGAGRKPKKPERRGGRREGAGRKPLVEGEKRQRIQLYVRPRTYDRYLKLKNKGFDMSVQINKLIDDLCDLMGIE